MCLLLTPFPSILLYPNTFSLPPNTECMNFIIKNKFSFIQQICEHLSSSLPSDHLEQILGRYTVSFLNTSISLSSFLKDSLPAVWGSGSWNAYSANLPIKNKVSLNRQGFLNSLLNILIVSNLPLKFNMICIFWAWQSADYTWC